MPALDLALRHPSPQGSVSFGFACPFGQLLRPSASCCPDLLSPPPPAPGPPYATTVPEHASVRAGEAVQLQCLAHGTPPLTFQWSRVGGRLPAGATTRGELLLFEAAAPEDSGRYRCQVTNRVGLAEAFAQVLVQGERPRLGLGRTGVCFSSRCSSEPFTYPTAGASLGAQSPPLITVAGTPAFPLFPKA